MPINSISTFSNLMLVNRINTFRGYVEKSTERLSTGKSINSAADSPSDILRISRLSSQIRGTQAAQRNIQDAISLTQIMDNSLAQMYDMGLRLKELSVQYRNSSLYVDEKDMIEKEAAELIKEMKVIMEYTKFNGINVFKHDRYEFQTGNTINDKATIENPLEGKEIIYHTPAAPSVPSTPSVPSIPSENKEVISRTYDIRMQLPFGQSLPGEIKLNLKDVEQDKDINFSINTSSGEPSKGKLNFVDDDTARFEINYKSDNIWGHPYNIKLTGTIELADNADKTNLAGEGTYKMDIEFGGWSGKITFTLKSQEEVPIPPDNPDPPDDPNPPGNPGEEKRYDFEDIDIIPIRDILDGDFVDKNILSTLAGSRANIGAMQNILEFKMSRQAGIEVIMADTLSRIEDVDIAKEMMEKVKYDLLLQTNLQLFSQNLDDQRNYVLQLISINDKER